MNLFINANGQKNSKQLNEFELRIASENGLSKRPEQRNVPVFDNRQIQMSKYKGSNPGAVNDLANIMRSQ